jgi:phage terminase large subunit GpA-like protein
VSARPKTRAIPADQYAIELPALLAALDSIRLRAFAPLSTVAPREFAERTMRMPDAHGATRPFSFDFAPYQLQPYLELFNRRNQEVCMMMASRLGKSRIVLTALGFKILHEPCRIGVMWPVEGDAKLWSKDDFMGELVEPTPEIAALIDDATGQRKSANTLLHKRFLGGLIQMFGANAPGRVRRFKGALLYADEIDAIHIQQNDEGNILLIFKKRGAEFADVIEIYCSYPSLKGRSNIESKMLTSDWRVWLSTCLLCGGEPLVMHRTGQVHYPDGFKRTRLLYDRDRPQDARLECPHCLGLLTDQQRYHMMLGGDPKRPRFDLWHPTRPFTGKAGFHAGAMLWPHPVDPLKYPGGFLQLVAQQEIDAENADNPERARRVIVNTIDSDCYESELDAKPEHSVLFNRREKYDPAKMLPAGVLWIAFACDVQADRIEVEIAGFGEKGHTWGLAYHVIKGTPMTTPDKGVWAELDRIISTTTYPHPSGKVLRISAGLIDRGYKPDHVLAFTRARVRSGIFASRGSTTLCRPIVSPRPKMEGNPKTKVWELGTHEAKDIIYQRLSRDNPAAEGFLHYPALGCYSEYYFRTLIAEDSTMEKAGDGKFYRCFRCDDGVRNEGLDLRVMLMAIERIRKPKYKKLAQELAAPAGPSTASPGAAAPGAASNKQPPDNSQIIPKNPPKQKPFATGATRRPGRGFVSSWRR